MIKISSFPAFLAAILGLGMGLFLVFLYYRKVEDKSSYFFGFICLATAMHAYGIGMLQNCANFNQGLLWSRFLSFADISLAFFYIIFLQEFTGKKNNIIKTGAFILFIIFIVFLPTDYFLKLSYIPRKNEVPFLASYGPLYFVFGIYVLFTIFYSLHLLLNYKMKTESKNDNKLFKTNTILVGTIFLGAAAINDLIGMFPEVNTISAMHYALLGLCLTFTSRIFFYQVNLIRSLKRSYLSSVMALVNSLEAKDNYTSGHSQRVRLYSSIIAKEMKLSPEEISSINVAALLHDIGKIGIPDTILNKPDKLDESEWELMKTHSSKGKDILSPIDYLTEETRLILYHHERFDGKGYPDGLAFSQIPLGSQIISLADAFDAMTTGRHYKKRIAFEDAINEINRNKGSQFNPDVVDSFFLKKEEIKKIFLNDTRIQADEALASSN